MLEDLLRLAVADAVLVFGSFILLWAISMALRDSSLVDIWFAPCIGAAAVLGVFVANGAEPRRVLIAVLAVLWSARLGGYLAWRNWGREDPRYARSAQARRGPGQEFRLAQPDAYQSVPRCDRLRCHRAFSRRADRSDTRGARPAGLVRLGPGADRRRLRGHRGLAAHALQGGNQQRRQGAGHRAVALFKAPELLR